MLALLERWEQAGEHVTVPLVDARGKGDDVRVWTRMSGEGTPTYTFWHGFPTSSYDWWRVDALLAGARRVYLDLPGFGASEKPAGFRWTFDAWLGAAEAVWRRWGVQETHLVCHDLAVSMAQEMFARMDEGRWTGPRIRSVTFLNGGLFADVYRPLFIQRLLVNRVTGPMLRPVLNNRTLERAMRRISSREHRLQQDDLDAMWAHIEESDGPRIYHRLSRYQIERKAKRHRWTKALAETNVPLRFLWGLQDPISGDAMVAAIRARVPQGAVTAWDDVGHYVQLEVPERVAAALPR